MSKRNGDRARFHRQRQARLLRRRRAAELMQKIKSASTAVAASVNVPV